MAEGQKKQIALIAIVVVSLAAAGLIALRRPSKGPLPGSYVYDLASGKLLVQRPGEPLPAGELVAAAVYSCSACADPSTHFIGYLSKESDELTRAKQSGEPPTTKQMQEGSLVRTVEGKDWIIGSSEAGMVLVRAATQKCPPDKPATLCTP